MVKIAHIKNHRILFSALNWGFGHVSRSIPILVQLIGQNNTLVVACTLEQQTIFHNYLTNVTYIRLEGYPFSFSGKGNFALDLLKNGRSLVRFAKRESSFVTEYANKYGISMIVSDHRYFFRKKNVPSVFITHQITLPLPWFLKLGQFVHRFWMNSFSEIWILDTDQHDFAGKLSKGKTKSRQIFLGPVSRFQFQQGKYAKSGIAIVVSGPQPYAEQFYVEQKAYNGDGVLIFYKGKLETVNGIKTLGWKEMDVVLMGSQKIISRSGYSTIMDLFYLQCAFEFAPTKGQWEQVYLADLHRNKLKM